MTIAEQEFPSIHKIFDALPAALLIYIPASHRLRSINSRLQEIIGCEDTWNEGRNLFSIRRMFEFYELRKILAEIKKIQTETHKDYWEFSLKIKTRNNLQRLLNFRIDSDKISNSDVGYSEKRAFIISIYNASFALNTDRTNTIISRLNSLNENRRRNRRVKAVIDSDENEREELAYELHDELGVNLSHINYGLQLIRDLNHKLNNTEQDTIIRELTGLCRDSITKIRRIHDNLAPAGLKEFGLETITRRIIEAEFKSSEITAHLDSNLGKIRFPDFIELNYYRIALELIDNAEKFSQAKNLYVVLRYEFDRLTLLVADDGIGFNPDKLNETDNKLVRKKVGNGLRNIQERCKILNCSFTIFAARNEGCRFTVEKKIKSLL